MKTYLDKLLENKEFKEKFDKEYAELLTTFTKTHIKVYKDVWL
jgi:hypothetical protein